MRIAAGSGVTDGSHERARMSLTLIFLNLAGGVALLLWAVRMVRTGVERAFGAGLERTLKRARDTRVRAALFGALTAVVLQGATAVAVLASGFVASRIMGLTMALSMVLGADLGSAVVAGVLSLDLSWLAPLLMIAGVWLFMASERRELRQTGRILLGIGLVLVALRLIGEATASMRGSELLPMIVGYLSEDYVSSFLLGALFTWAVHSSVASILLVAKFAAEGLVPTGLAIALVLGANFGSGLIAFMLTRASTPEARRVALGNLIFRGAGAVLALIVFGLVDFPVHLAGETPAQQVIILHIAFNLVLAVVCLPLVGMAAPLLEAVLPKPREHAPADLLAGRVSALDRSVLDNPRLALASATREVLRMAEIVELMLRPVMELYETGDMERIRQIRALDKEVNRAHADVKLYLVELAKQRLSAEEAKRAMVLANFAINLEHAGDIIAKTLLRLAEEKNRRGLVFSEEGWRELTDLHAKVLTNMELALNVLVSGDRDSARELIREKDRMRELELASQRRHLERLQSGTVESVETSELHLETIRALKQLNSLFASVAYAILEESGELLESRLAKAE